MASTEPIRITRGPASVGAVPVKAGENVPTGTLVFVDGGYAVPDAGGNAFAGVAEPGFDNTGGGDGDETVETVREGQFVFKGTGFTQADVQKKAYAVDNDTVSKTATGNSYIGTITEFIDSEHVLVSIDTLAA